MITIEQIIKLSDSEYKYVNDRIDFKDADNDFISAFRSKDEAVYCIYDDNKPLGLVEFIIEKNAYLYIYINPLLRNRGFGSSVLELCEEKLVANNVENVMTRYINNDNEAKTFAYQKGYRRKFSSRYMKYTDGKFDVPDLPVKQYQDKYYESAHEMYARVFHEMRKSVGDFPDSVVEQPNENMRNNWSNTAYERFVYIQDDIVIGYAHIEGNCIGSISIRKEYQGQGFGRNFMKFICNEILNKGYEEVFLYCVLGNNNASKLYDSLNFRELYTVEYAIKE